MSRRCLRIPIEAMDLGDETFRSSFQRDLRALHSSIRSAGVLVRPRVQSLNSRYRIVSGFLRVEVCSHQCMKEMEVEVLGRETPEEKLFLETLHENRFTRGFNWAEQACVLERLMGRWNWSRAQVVEKAMPALGLEPAPKLLEDYLRVASLHGALKREMIRNGCSLANALRIAEWSVEDQAAFAPLLDRLHLGENLLREFLGLIHEICLRDGISPAEFLRERQVMEIIQDDLRDRPWRTNSLRSYIRKRRYPNLASMEAAFHGVRSCLHLPRTISVRPSPFFEAKEITVSFRAKTPGEMRSLCERLWEACQNEQDVQRLFEAMDRAP